ncbi:MAG: flagellar basal body P-ring formation chaperone FlgA [Acidobacteriia bacterium]|nr:flagellar basal body P-ring formation chaperone FlgA [Terriglobia bacterium]
MTSWLLLLGMMQLSSACQNISGERILGEDLARALPVFASMPADAVIGYSPAPGAARVVRFPELKRIGMKYGISAPHDSRACFEWKLATLTEGAVRSAMLRSLNAPQARVDVLAVSKSQLPDGKLEFPLSGLSVSSAVDPATPVIWHGYVLYGKTRRFAVWARVRVASTSTRVVAVEALTPGQAVGKRQVRLETYDEFPLHNEVARNLEEVVGRVPLRGIRAGLPVFRTDLVDPFQVQRGELVKVTAISGAAQVELDAVAGNSGRRGDMITVANPRSGKTFAARIEGPGKAVVISGPAGLLGRVQ